MPAPIMRIFLGATVAVIIGKRASETPATAIVLCLRNVRRVIDISWSDHSQELNLLAKRPRHRRSSAEYRGFAAAHRGKPRAYRTLRLIELEASPLDLLRHSLGRILFDRSGEP